MWFFAEQIVRICAIVVFAGLVYGAYKLMAWLCVDDEDERYED